MSSSVRDKTQRHLNRLATAAAVASTVASAEACKNSGYAVVDPMPPPSRCPGAAGAITASAKWIDTPKGRRIELLLSQPHKTDYKLGDPSGVRTSSSGPPDEAVATADGLRIVTEMQYPPYVNVDVPVACMGGNDAGLEDYVHVGITATDASDTIQVQLTEY